MLDSFVTSKTRIKLLLKFFINPDTTAYLRGLADEFGESTNAVRVELNRLSKAGILESKAEGRTILYNANKKHPLFPEIQRIVAKTVGLDRLVEQVVARLGSVELAFVTGDYARGIDSGLIDLVLVGEVDEAYLGELAKKAEKLIGRKIPPRKKHWWCGRGRKYRRQESGGRKGRIKCVRREIPSSVNPEKMNPNKLNSFNKP